MGNSNYNLDSLIAWCSSLRILIRATAYFLRMVGRRNLYRIKKGDIDISDYCIQQVEISRSEYDDAWNFLVSWEQSQRLDRK